MRRAAINPTRQKPFGLWLKKEQQFAALPLHSDHVDLVLGDKRRAIRIVSENDLRSAAVVKRHTDLDIFIQLVDQIVPGIQE